MKKYFAGFAVFILALLLMVPLAVSAAPVAVDFETGFAANDSVEGLGTLDANLQITTTGDPLVVVEEGNGTYLAYSANLVLQNDTPNGNLDGSFGFADIVRNTNLGFYATFNGNTVTSFSIDMFDYGDWFPYMANYTGTKTHTISLVAYDSGNVEIDSDTLTFTSTGGSSTGRTMTTLNGTDITDKPLSSAGDALQAAVGDPGLWSFAVSGSGIFKVAMEFDGNDSIDSGVAWDNVAFEIEETEIDVYVDIKPQSCPNPLNLGSKGVVSVAILGTESFDVTNVDPATIMLEGVSPLRWSLEDVATPYTGELVDCNSGTTEGPDGYMDLVFKFDKEELIAAIGEVEEGCLLLELNGALFDTTEFIGYDFVKIIDNENNGAGPLAAEQNSGKENAPGQNKEPGEPAVGKGKK